MQTKWTAPSRETLAAAPSVSARKAPERLLRHLAGSHRELAVAAFGIGVAADPDVVGRIQEGGIDPGALADHLSARNSTVAAVAAADAVLAKIQMSPGLVRGVVGTGGITSSSGSAARAEQHVDLAGRKTGERQIEVDVERGELGQLHLQDVEIPAGVESDLVVGDAKRPLLGLGQARGARSSAPPPGPIAWRRAAGRARR